MTNQQSFDMSKRKLFIAIPSYDFKVSLKLAISLAQFTQVAPKHGVDIAIGSICGCSVVSRARNLLADQFLESDCTDLLFIDSDINFDSQDIFRLMAWSSDYGIVGGVPRVRKDEETYIVTLDKVDEDSQVVMNAMGLVRAKRIATAFMMVQRRVFETLRDAHPEWMYFDDKSENAKSIYSFFDFKSTPGGYIGEDYLFCDRAREHGFEVWVDPTIKLGHMGIHEYMGDFGNQVLYPMLTPMESKKEVA